MINNIKNCGENPTYLDIKYLRKIMVSNLDVLTYMIHSKITTKLKIHTLHTIFNVLQMCKFYTNLQINIEQSAEYVQT